MTYQSMESAPKDGTKILVLDETGEAFVVSWMVDYDILYPKENLEKYKAWCIPESYQDEQGGYFTVTPVKWMPIP